MKLPKKRYHMCKGMLEKSGKKLIDCVWFSSFNDLFGVVISLDKDNELRAHIGQGKGVNEAFDAINIMDWGAPFPIKAAMELFGEDLNNKVSVSDCEYYSCIAELLKDSTNQTHPSWL